MKRLLAIVLSLLSAIDLASAGGLVIGGPAYEPPPSVVADFERWRAPESPDSDGPETPMRPRPDPAPEPQPEDPKEPIYPPGDKEPPKEPCPPETNLLKHGGGGGC